jgi:hypothetical protein
MGLVSRWTIIALSLACAGAVVVAQRVDPDESLARVRVIVTTNAASASVTVSGATIASYIPTVDSGPAAMTVSRTGRVLQLSRNAPGQTAEARFDIVLADVVPDATVVWKLSTDAGADTQILVQSLNDVDRPALVDRFTSTAATAQFATPARLIASFGSLRMTPVLPRLVLAHYYPWYTVDMWSDPQMADRPLRLYSTDAQADVNAQAVLARTAGIDAFVVSWQGLEAGDGFNDRRMRIALNAAAAAGMRACVYTETYVANPTNDATRGIDPRTLLDWLTEIVDRYGSDPAYLRVAGRPVIFTYAASLLPASDWTEVIARLRSSGRNPIIIGDFAGSVLLEPFDGEYQYSNVFSSGASLTDLDRAESLRVRTLSLVRPDEHRRIWVASVTPGFDDSHLVARRTPRVVNRSNGAVYDDQWSNAIGTGADWVVVTSWNEWWENTHIEPGVRYGTSYVERTRVWADRFKALSAPTPPEPSPIVKIPPGR